MLYVKMCSCVQSEAESVVGDEEMRASRVRDAMYPRLATSSQVIRFVSLIPQLAVWQQHYFKKGARYVGFGAHFD